MSLRFHHFIILILFLFILSYSKDSVYAQSFGLPHPVKIDKLPNNPETGLLSTEEPFISRDGRFLFFNSGKMEGNKDLHYAKQNKYGRWVYQGEIGVSINTPKEVQGNPTMDANYQFFYIDSSSKSMIHTGRFNPQTGKLEKSYSIKGLPQKEVRLFKQRIHGNMGVEVSEDGNTLYFSRATWKIKGVKMDIISASDILFARKISGQFVYDKEYVKKIMANINTEDLEYAASISKDGLELFFTRLSAEDLKNKKIQSQIMVAKRKDILKPFEKPQPVDSIGSHHFVEGPALSPDERELMYHKKDGPKFHLYEVSR